MTGGNYLFALIMRLSPEEAMNSKIYNSRAFGKS
jgi:hypothetical protein